jgi:type III secretion protein U
VALLVAIDLVLEYLLYLRELKMSREEVKREMREIERSPEVKKEQRRLSNELLSGETEQAVRESNFIVANPTHIAVGIYFNFEISQLPFISLIETDERAQAVIAYARRLGLPVMRHVRLARRIFSKYKRYTFIKDEALEDVMEVLNWLMDIERSRRAQYLEDEPNAEKDESAVDSSTQQNDPDVAQQDPNLNTPYSPFNPRHSPRR